jgi:hypothetical protein
LNDLDKQNVDQSKEIKQINTILKQTGLSLKNEQDDLGTLKLNLKQDN